MNKISAITSAALLATLLAGGGALAAAKPVATSSTPYVTIAGINQGGPMNWFSPEGNVYPGMDLEPLAYHKLEGTNINAFFAGGGLASKWQTSNGGHTLTVWLNPKDRWSNGQAVTSSDVVTSMALYFVAGDAQGFDLGSVKALGPKEIQFNEVAGDNYNAFSRSILEEYILPASVYGGVLPKNIWSIIDQSIYSGTNAKLIKEATAAQATLSTLNKTKLDTLAPKTDVSAGPYYISSLSPDEIIMTKNPYFYDANKISIDTVDMRNNASNSTVFEWLRGGQIYQGTSGGMSLELVHELAKTPGNVYYHIPAYVTAQLAFNEKDYPYGMVQVRQAIAYLLNKHTIWQIAEPTGGTRSLFSDGMIDAQTEEYLDPSQKAALNPYTPNQQAAAKLLESVGFTKKGSQWYTPKGQVFSINIMNVSGFNDWIEAGSVMESELNSFGIKTKQTVVATFAEYEQNQTNGEYAVQFWIGSLGPWIYNTYDRLYGAIDGYAQNGTKLQYTPASKKDGGNWLDFPQTVKVKGYGTVNPGKLTNELSGNLTQAQTKTIVAKLAAVTNQYVPVITLWNYAQAGFVNTNLFTDYPLNNQQLMVSTEGQYPPIGGWETFGYVHPKQ
ncbi:MAG: ABC transporter substrate-binding protein [Firmicutes bacterium]|jgi:peptide/nickel transport system substrate-binding protein|nr:ABC transporter substrate-binding protein [Bacillota bacterium]